MSDVHWLETTRLLLRWFEPSDASFFVELLNDPAFIKNVADRNVRTREDALAYIEKARKNSYEKYGYGSFVVELKETKEKVGICSLVLREGLSEPDIGFAFLPPYRSQGYAYEASAAAMLYAKETLRLPSICAITVPTNERSMKLLEKLGLRFQKMVRLPNDTVDCRLYRLKF